MKKPIITQYIKIVLVIGLAFLLLFGGNALAQFISTATEPGGEVIDEMPPSYVSGDPAYLNILPPDENPTNEVNNPAATFSYYQVAGATLRGRNSTTGYVYDGVGCSNTTSGVDQGRILNTELIIPDNAVIKYLRVYYRDTNPSNGVEGYITRYQPGTATVDLVHTGSSDAFQGGYGFVVSAQITETVNNTLYAYTLIGWPDENNAANQICGLRVAYYAPFHANIFMPVVRR
ncbi:MAG: hypothetical protein A2030_08205 [Chloroflexi bacterium RBG_19FT_COMBO_50_10]|nr:MAG: hypothetical protein A2Y53_04395 [Chloroflexi bacterium RBG_16_47_49]OGO66299.1 MAG: hypothetical protein A2030_08205 [Chloroflexi bacterium RBG_19FT_COMBO_50_10]